MKTRRKASSTWQRLQDRPGAALRLLVASLLLAPTVLHVFVHTPSAPGPVTKGQQASENGAQHHHHSGCDDADCPICALRMHEDATLSRPTGVVADPARVLLVYAACEGFATGPAPSCIAPRGPPLS